MNFRLIGTLFAFCLLGTSAAAEEPAKCSIDINMTQTSSDTLIDTLVPPRTNPDQSIPSPHVYLLVNKDLSKASVTTKDELDQMQSQGFGSHEGDTVVVLQETQYPNVYAIIIFGLSKSHRWDDPNYTLAEAVGPLGTVGLLLMMPTLGYAVGCGPQ